MDWQFTPYTPFLLITTVATAVLTILVHRRPAAAAGMPATALFVAISGWNLAYALELSCRNLPAQMLWANVEYIFIAAIPVLWLMFATSYTGREHWLPRGLLALLFVEPAVIVFLAWGSETYPYLRPGPRAVEAGGWILVEWQFGPFFWFHTLYAYTLMMLGTFLLIPVILRSPFLYRAQALFVLVGVLAPWIANAMYISGVSPLPHLDLTPFAFALAAAAVAFGLLRLQLLDGVPVTRDLDLGIPGLPGDEVARRIREEGRRLTTVLMTGWSLSPEDSRRQFFDLAIQKPFDGRVAEAGLVRAVELQCGRSPVPPDQGSSPEEERDPARRATLSGPPGEES